MYFDLARIDWTAIASMIAAGTLVYFVLHLIIMKKQMKSQYRPKICIPDDRFIIEIANNGIPNIWIRQFDEKRIGLPPLYDLKILNIGLAAAIDIEITWKVDIQKIREKFNRLSTDKSSKVSRKSNTDNIQYFYESTVPNNYGFLLQEDDLSSFFSVLSKENELEARLPEIIYNYVSYYLYELFRIEKVDRKVMKFDQPIELLVEYYNIGKNKETQKYNCRIEVIYYNKPFLKNRIAIGKIEFRETK
jgi:hypothetical protein